MFLNLISIFTNTRITNYKNSDKLTTLLLSLIHNILVLNLHQVFFYIQLNTSLLKPWLTNAKPIKSDARVMLFIHREDTFPIWPMIKPEDKGGCICVKDIDKYEAKIITVDISCVEFNIKKISDEGLRPKLCVLKRTAKWSVQEFYSLSD